MTASPRRPPTGPNKNAQSPQCLEWRCGGVGAEGGRRHGWRCSGSSPSQPRDDRKCLLSRKYDLISELTQGGRHPVAVATLSNATNETLTPGQPGLHPNPVCFDVWASAFDDGDGPQLDGLAADAGLVTRVHHVRHVFVRLRSLKRERVSARVHVHAGGRPLTSSITSLGEATLMAMPWSASLSRTSWKSRLRRDLARDSARP